MERLAKKNEGLIQDLVEENMETSHKITQIEQTVDGINQKVENIQDLTVTVEGVTSINLNNCDINLLARSKIKSLEEKKKIKIENKKLVI